MFSSGLNHAAGLCHNVDELGLGIAWPRSTLPNTPCGEGTFENIVARRTRTAGFGLVELMVVLTIASVVMSLGAPAMRGFLQNNRLHATTLRLSTDINFARSEAVKRKVRIVLCRSANPSASTPTCSGNTRIWTSGWLIFAAGDTNSTYEAGTDSLLRLGNPATGSDLAVMTNSTSNRNLEYNSDGSTNEGGGTARFAICDGRGGSTGRQINVPPHGRLRAVKGSSSNVINCGAPS